MHFTGRIPYQHYLQLLRRSSVHVYPFVLSWSLLEAMSAGCLVVGSRTPPVEEVIRDRENGLLVDFFSSEQLAATVHRALSMKEAHDLRERARATGGRAVRPEARLPAGATRPRYQANG